MVNLLGYFIKIKHFVEFCIVKLHHKQGFFYKGRYYPYFYNMYNATWKFDRRYEIPIFIKEIEDYSNEDILEIGNTLSHYVDVDYDILDKYEKEEGIINEDIRNFNPNKKYGLIISISTLEHIGLYQYGKGNLENIKESFENICSLLNPKGKFIFSYTSDGYNPKLEDFIKKLGIMTKYYKIIRKGKKCGVRIGEIFKEDLNKKLNMKQ